MIEKLTFEGNFCDIAQCQEPYPCKYTDTSCAQKQVWERLKEYEDIFGGEDIDVLSKLWEAYKEGRCIISPCKVGDVVYVINRDGDKSIGEYRIDAYNLRADRNPMGEVSVYNTFWAFKIGRHDVFRLAQEDFGKTVFLTREEAEAALKKECK